MILRARGLTLPYARPFGIARWTRTSTENVVVRVEAEGSWGIGEGAPNARYGEDMAGALAALEALPPISSPTSLGELEATLASLAEPLRGNHAALAALDGALCDWLARAQGVPLSRLLGLAAAPGPGPRSSLTIGLGAPDAVASALRAAAAYPLLKIKLGADEVADTATLARLRQITAKPLRVDANEGWGDREVAIRRMEALAVDGGVELVEQPLPAGRLGDVAWLRARSPLPLVADEDCVPGVELAALAEVYDGVNIKLDKEGGILAARRRVAEARACGLDVMLGCMVASSLALTQAAQVALEEGVRWADLDGHLLLADDPYEGLTLDADARIWLPEGRRGLGVRRRPVVVS